MAFGSLDFKASKFRNPANNQRYTRSLFFETNASNPDNILYTLKRQDHNNYPSLYRLYIEEEDPTEFDFANRYFEDYDHWLVLTNTEWFKPYISQWRDELQRKLTARAMKIIKAEAEGKGRNALAAAKYLMERGWETREEKKKIIDDARHAAQANEMSREDEEMIKAAERIGLKLVSDNTG
jgi:hypothetical protein